MQVELAQFLEVIEDESVLIIDARPSAALMLGYVPNAIHITPATAKYAIAMDIIRKDSPLIFILEEAIAAETLAYFTKAGFTDIKGYLNGGFTTWAAEKRCDLIIDVMVLDCRTEADFDKNHIKNSVSLPLADMGDPGSMSELDEHFNIYILTENGDNSTLAASLLKKQGIHNIRVVVGGWEAVQTLKDNFSFEVTKVKPTTDEDILLN